jgi:hypothetical protein
MVTIWYQVVQNERGSGTRATHQGLLSHTIQREAITAHVTSVIGKYYMKSVYYTWTYHPQTSSDESTHPFYLESVDRYAPPTTHKFRGVN